MPEPLTLPISLGGKVGYHGQKSGRDVEKIHWLLSRIPGSLKGTGHLLGKPYTQGINGTDAAILAFQKAHFTDRSFHDATVWPNGETLKKMNALADGSVVAPPPATMPAPAPVAGGGIPRAILAIVGATPSGHAYVKGFDGKHHKGVGRFRVPTYPMTIGPRSASGGGIDPVEAKTNQVITWGVKLDSVAYEAGGSFSDSFKMVPPKFGDFDLVTINSKSLGKVWQLQGEYLLHDGPSNPTYAGSSEQGDGLVGALGCVEVCGKQSWKDFMQEIRRMAFGDDALRGMTAEQADSSIVLHKAFHITVEHSAKPQLWPLTDFRAIGGPPPKSA